MARIRTIKPEFWRDEFLSKVSAEACLLAIGLLNHCDDEGYFNANPKLVDADVFPLRELSFPTTTLLQELSKIGYIQVFQGSDGKVYGQVTNFEKHQVINKKTPSKIKHLCKLPQDYGSDQVALPIGKEGKGKEEEGKGYLSIPNGIDSPSDDEPDQPSRFPKCEHQAVVDLYHQTLPTLPKVEVWNNLRAGLLRQRWREVCEDLTKKGPVTEQVILDWWRDFFVFVGKAPFLVGKTYSKDKRPFLADLEWIIRPTNFVKIVEGKYHRS